MGLIAIFVIFFLASSIIGNRLKKKFREYSRIPVTSGMSGKEVAEKMLNDYGIYNVNVTSVKGELTDHYNPVKKMVNLSHDVYHGRNVSAASVAAHECGHAVQHAQAYFWLQFRSTLVPIQNVSARIINIIFVAMFLGAFILPSFISLQSALLIIIACYSVFTLFAFVTLPVELDASRRALAWLQSTGVTTGSTQEKAKDGLKWAAYTYLVAALASLATLLYYILLFVGMSDD
ncbi:zinc metallopeptidase [Bacteroidota bacterium]